MLSNRHNIAPIVRLPRRGPPLFVKCTFNVKCVHFADNMEMVEFHVKSQISGGIIVFVPVHEVVFKEHNSVYSVTS